MDMLIELMSLQGPKDYYLKLFKPYVHGAARLLLFAIEPHNNEFIDAFLSKLPTSEIRFMKEVVSPWVSRPHYIITALLDPFPSEAFYKFDPR
jgi:hypothetical protein